MNEETRQFRNTLGQFATGVTVVTTTDDSGEPVGMTATSFNSVSLDPPLVLWSIDKKASNYDTFNTAEYFAIHVLAQGQDNLSGQFAQKETDRFADLDCRPGVGDAPILPEFTAVFQCSIAHRYDGGDHTILLGKVEEYESQDRLPLLFHCGRYAKIA
tara:strand:+ start:2662 stop:3135 length:474 start_codon:yes stop_codon:yes gene_type:complete